MEKFKALTSPKSDEQPKEDDVSSTKTNMNDAIESNNILSNTSAII